MIIDAINEASTKWSTTPEEVLKEIQTAINIGYNSDNPIIRARWHRLGFYQKPTPEEFILAIAMIVEKLNRRAGLYLSSYLLFFGKFYEF